MPSIIVTPIQGFLYLGTADAAKDQESLARYKIRKILSVTNDKRHRPSPEFCKKLGIEQKIFPIDDTYFEDPSHILGEDIFPWVYNAETENIHLLVHCYASISRSPSLVITYLAWHLLRHDQIPNFESAFDSAYQRVMARHGMANPQLVVLDSFLKCIGYCLPKKYWGSKLGWQKVRE